MSQHNQHNIKEFNPYTFYFVNAIDNGSINAAADIVKPNDNCYVEGNLKYDNEGCNIPNDCSNPVNTHDAKTCLKYAYYKNKEQALKYLEATNQDVGSEQKYMDMKADYNEELINSMNLTLGSIVLAGFIIKNLFYP